MRAGVLLIAVLLLAGCGGVSQAAYESKNEAIVESLPVFPGAVKIHEVSTPWVKSEGGLSTQPSGYDTTVVYRVPRGTTDAAVERFYAARLPRRGWRRVSAIPGDFTKDNALVGVNTAFLTRTQRRLGEQVYDILVDYRGATRA